MDKDKVLQLRNKLSIVDVISNYINLEKKGRNYFGVCPFHEDHSPSLCVSPEKQIYTCFVCHESGNVFDFVKKYLNISFPETLKILSEGTDITFDNLNIKDNSINNHLYEAMDLANLYFQNNLNSDLGKEALDYLDKRKLTPELIKEFGVGLSISKLDELTNLLLNKGYTVDELNDIDLSNNNHDTFINRITFPIHDKNNKVVGFSARIYKKEDIDLKKNKYLNTKESILYHKRENLYNLNRALNDIRINNSIIIMEGFMAVIRAYSIGIKNCVATMGTALTNENLKNIIKTSKNIYLCFDGDNAGHNATLKNGEMFLKENINPKVICLEDNLDPDDYILKNGEEAFKNLINNAITFKEYKNKLLKGRYDLSKKEDRINYTNERLNDLINEEDPITLEINLEDLSKDVEVSFNTLKSKLETLKNKEIKVSKKEEIPELTVKKRNHKLDVQKNMDSLIYYMLENDKVINMVNDSNVIFPNKLDRLLANSIIEFYSDNGYINIPDMFLYLEDNEDLYMYLKEIVSDTYPPLENLESVKELLTFIKKVNKEEKLKKLDEEFNNTTDTLKQLELLAEIAKIKGI